jgi:glycosyltransferase involved in cell wall biosynthesis
MKIAVITCYHDPDYVRARTIRAALKKVPGVSVIEVKNTSKGVLRYPQVVWRLWRTKKQQNPDAYVLTFRGQEILPFVQLLIGKKPLIFDEFIIPIAYASGESHKKTLKIRVFYALARLSEPLYRSWLKRCAVVLADTKAHAELSARTSNMNLSSYVALPVGTDEKAFKPSTKKRAAQKKFRVFYYSTGMQPLHGIGYVLEAAELLKNDDSIEFLIVGGKKPLRDAVAAAASKGAHVRYEAWIPFNDLLTTMYEAGLNMGGPFGGTNQAQHVITGKSYQMLAAAVPVLVGDSEATREYFLDKENALVVPQANPEAIKKAILWAQKHPLDLRQIALNGRKLYEKNFSTVALTKIWQSIVAGL